jgi:hypothetical protein
MSANNVTLGLLSLAYLTQYDDLQFIPFSFKCHDFIFHYDWVLGVVKTAAVNTDMQSISHTDLHAFNDVPKSGMARSWSSSIVCVLGDLHTDFLSACTSWHSHQQHVRVPFSLYACQHLSLFVFLVIVNLTGLRWNLDAVLICISFITKDVEEVGGRGRGRSGW